MLRAAQRGPTTRLQRRSQKRIAVGLKGRIYMPERDCEEDCEVVDLSPDGAGLASAARVAVGTHVVIYLESFGRFEGVVARTDGDSHIGVRFQSTDNKRIKIAEQIAAFLASGIAAAPSLHRGLRSKRMPMQRQFVGADGNPIDCEIVDISLGGAALRTASRPELGSQVKFGVSTGRVVRHTSVGIDVEFLDL